MIVGLDDILVAFYTDNNSKMMEATTESAVQESLGKQMPRDVSDDDIFKPRNQPTTDAIITESHAEKVSFLFVHHISMLGSF